MPTYKYLDGTGLERTLSKLKTYIDSQSGGSDGHGFIICDTSTMQVGDKIRVRSVYTVLEEQYNQTKEVVTVGQPVTFTVPPYDYYKICTVQDIGGVSTEVGGTYRTIDYGQTIFVDVLDKTTLGGIQGILNAHQETSLLQIGDEVTITVSGSPWVMQVADINTYHSHSVILVSKNLWETSMLYNATSGSLLLYANTDAYAEMTSFYNNMVEKQYVKELRKTSMSSVNGTSNSFYAFDAHVWIPNCYEVQAQYQDNANPKKQFALFQTQANRVRTYNNVAQDYWTCDGWYTQGSFRKFCIFVANGSGISNVQTDNVKGLLPCFEMVADS